MVTTGLPSLDKILTGLRAGDNVVWQVDDIKDYKRLVTPYVQSALGSGRKVVYMRFADHEPLLKKTKGVTVYVLAAHEGFEQFSTRVNRIITEEGLGAHYVFDSLSSLLSIWATDLMVGNFFMVTCPYLYELDTVAYFGILRNHHSFKTIARIRETTQLLLDVYGCDNNYYVHPLKVWNRYSPTMFLPHLKKGDEFIPVTDSGDAAEVLTHISGIGMENARRNLDYWDRLFLKGEDLIANKASSEEKNKMLDMYCNMLLSRNKKILDLAKKNFTLEDIIKIKSRVIGTGSIGGKAVGMLLARKILTNNADTKWKTYEEPHDSFYIGSDVFYTYMVQNGWWKLRLEQKTSEGYFDAARVLKEKMLYGKFPEEVMEQFQQIIEYFGTSPIIVRSSSLLEDGFGNAFAGKYESFFCANQGSPEQRYMQFVEAVKKIYASMMNEDALVYRQQRGLDAHDEQMALLVQRVSGSSHKKYFFPDMGGVGVSYNTYVWNNKMNSEAGMVRVVLGLGTRAVDRVEGDYPRVAALDAPLVKPYADMSDIKRFSQRKVDLINIEKNSFETVEFEKLLEEDIDLNLKHTVIKDEEAMRWMKDHCMELKDQWIITFDELFSQGAFTDVMRGIMKTLEKNYEYPVEVEFTVNFHDNGKFKLNFLQCRPLQTTGIGKKVAMPTRIDKKDIFFESKGYFLGGNISQKIQRIIYVDPPEYIRLTMSEKYDIARLVGKLNKQISSKEDKPTLLLGPGRWGTSTPSLGVPVTFAEINKITAIGEIAFPEGNLMPELSYGTHFFQDLVETNIFYVGIFPDRKEVQFNLAWMSAYENLFSSLVPEAIKYQDVIAVYDVKEPGLKIMSDVLSQRLVCFSG
jgi:pyruvate phosphate dikinase-like enzyme